MSYISYAQLFEVKKMENLEVVVKNYFLDYRWNETKCKDCKKIYFTKQGYESCGYSNCSRPVHPSERLSGKPNNVRLEVLAEELSESFQAKGYTRLKGKSIDSSITTFFIGSAIQAVDSEIYGREKYSTVPRLVIQPAIRVNVQPQVGRKLGVSTAFTSVGTERINASPKEFITDLDNWLQFFSKISFPLTRMNFYFGDRWKGGEMSGISLTAYLGRLQIADFVYVDAIPFNERIRSISDVGTSLERLGWIISQVDEYFEAFNKPTTLKEFSLDQIDLIRTMTLPAGSRISGANKGKGNILRNFAKEYTKMGGSLRINSLVKEYYNYWSMFASMTPTLDNTQKVMQKEMNRAFNLNILERFNMKPSRTDYTIEPDEFIDKLMKEGSLTRAQVMRALRK